jgi:CRISPR-associated protein Cas5d
MLSEPICLRVKGPFACFTRPEFHVERVSYPVITPSAARGVLEAILMKPVEKPEAGKRDNKVGFRWHVLRLGIIHKGHLTPLLRNELGYAAHPAYGTASGYDCAEERQQRNSLILAGDVEMHGTRQCLEYLIEACIEVQPDLGLAGRRCQHRTWNAVQCLAKYQQMFTRRASAGQCFYQPFLGCREFSVAEWRLEEHGFDAALPTGLPDEQFGAMFRDFDFDRFWAEWRSKEHGDRDVILQAQKFTARALAGQIRLACRRDAVTLEELL